MELPATIFVALGAVIAALITGLFTFTNILISKDQKTSEFRQDWINKLRTEISSFTCSVGSFTSMLLYLKDQDDWESKIENFIRENIELVSEITKTYNSIRLRVNTKDDVIFLEKLGDVYKYAAGGVPDFTVNDVSESEDALIKESQLLLKNEWERVKRGETLYQITKWVALGLFVVAVIVGFVYVKDILALFQK